MYELKKNGNVFASKFVGTGPSSCEKIIYRAAISQRLRDTVLGDYHPYDTAVISSESYKMPLITPCGLRFGSATACSLG